MRWGLVVLICIILLSFVFVNITGNVVVGGEDVDVIVIIFIVLLVVIIIILLIFLFYFIFIKREIVLDDVSPQVDEYIKNLELNSI